MQTQDAPTELIFKLWPWLEANRTRLIGGAAGLLVVIGGYQFYSWQHEQTEIAAGEALTQLLVVPSTSANPGQIADAFAQLGSKYAGTAAGQRAQLQAGAALFSSGRYADAQAQFQKYLATGDTGPLAGTAQLGVGASLEA